MTMNEQAGAPSLTLADYGWSAHFERAIEPKEIERSFICRVMAVHRGALEVAGPHYCGRALPRRLDSGGEAQDIATVGDWLLVDRTSLRTERVIERRSLFMRRAAGTEARLQLIAANIDTLLIVSSCNHDFNIARIERYLALAREAQVTPVVVLSKADLAAEARDYVAKAARIARGLCVEALDTRSPEAVACLSPWLARGETVALMGSSGVGKSTLINTLAGRDIQATSTIRDGDDKGRHTTTARSLHRLSGGAWLLDTPGMRELQLAEAEAGIREVFCDLAELAQACRFADCRHEAEPGCAVRQAIADGSLDETRLKRYRKLLREDARNSETIAEAHRRVRSFARQVRRVMKAKRDGAGF